MDSNNQQTEIRKNVTIIAWVLIVLNAFGFYLTMSGNGLSVSSNSSGGSLNVPGFYFNSFSYIHLLSILLILGMIINIAVIYYAVRMFQFIEYGRNILSKLIIVSIIFNIMTFVLSLILINPFNFPGGISSFVSFSLIMALLKLIIFNGTIITMYCLFYRFLNKSGTKEVFKSVLAE